MTQRDVTSALGTDPGPGAAFSHGGASQCQYGVIKTGLVLVNVTPVQGRAAYDLVHDNPKLAQTVRVIDVKGVGDRAFEVLGAHNAGVYFNRADALVLVSIASQDLLSDAVKGQAVAMARTAAGRV